MKKETGICLEIEIAEKWVKTVGLSIALAFLSENI